MPDVKIGGPKNRIKGVGTSGGVGWGDRVGDPESMVQNGGLGGGGFWTIDRPSADRPPTTRLIPKVLVHW